MRRINGLRSMAEMVQNPLNHCGFLDAGNDAQAAAALLAGLDGPSAPSPLRFA